MTVSHTGRLLVAAPVLDDPNFARSVLLVLDHDTDGALGIVINRTSTVPLDEALASWAPLAAQPAVVFAGGPVEPTAVVALGRAADATADGNDDTMVFDRVRLVDLERDPRDAGAAVDRVRLFAGYAGWAPDQLEHEIGEGAWFVVDAEPGDVFTPTPDELWRDVLRRQRGTLRMLATFPDDPLAN